MPASASPGPPPASSSTASTAPTSPTTSSTWAKRAPTAPTTRSPPAPPSAPRSNAADLDYLVTTPFLNFIDPGTPIPSPEAKWLRGDPAAKPINRSGPVTVWKLEGKLDPSGMRAGQRPAAPDPEYAQEPVPVGRSVLYFFASPALDRRPADAPKKLSGGLLGLALRHPNRPSHRTQMTRHPDAESRSGRLDPHRDLALAGPVLGVDGVVLDRGSSQRP